MATKTIASDKSETSVGTTGTKLYTATRITYNEDNNGKIDPKSVKREILYYDSPTSSGVVAATSTGTSSDWTYLNKPSSNDPILGADAQKSLKEGALKTTTQQQIQTASTKAKISAEQQKSLTPSNNKATNPEGSSPQGGTTQQQQEEFQAEQSTFRKGTRESYQDLRYPENLALEHQDCIKFSILQYRPSAADAQKSGKSSGINRIVKVENAVPSIEGSKRLGTITLPIPAGISDSNSADWQSDSLNELQKMGLDIARSFITGGAESAGPAVERSVGRTQEIIKGDAQQGLAAKFAGLAVGSDKAQQRLYGSIFNNNLELLFNGPTLRSAFTFNFKLSPRSEPEAIIVRKIIRTFKQSMAVKRSATSLLLKSPHTFAIGYLTSNQEHPYLNKFKECALISCNVDYTPEGTYMTYMSASPDGRSMVSYNLSLTFQELEPIFDDDYGALDNNSDKFIGF
jgi:hypothetical protein